MPSTSRWIRPLKRSTMPFVLGVEGRVLRWITPSLWHAASNPSAVKQEPRSVSTWVTWKGKAWTASVRKATALRSVSSFLTARWTKQVDEAGGRSRWTKRVDEAGGAVDGPIEVALAALAVAVAQLGQVLHVHVHKAKVVVSEDPGRLARPTCGRQAPQALGFQNTVDPHGGSGGAGSG